MSRRYYYSVTISNSYLGKFKEVKGSTPAEVEMKAAEQVRKWEEQEKRQRERENIADLKSRAEFDTQRAKNQIENYKNILKATLKVNDKLNWDSLKKKGCYKTFSFSEVKPTQEKIYRELNVPAENKIIEFLFKSSKQKRLNKISEAENILANRLREYEEQKNIAFQQHQEEKQEFEKKQEEENALVDQFRSDFEQGHGEAIEKYIYLVLERSKYPDDLEREYEVQYDPISGTIIVSFELPPKDAMPKVVQYKFVASRKEIDPVEMKLKEFESFYEDVLYQICLRTIHEIFESIYISDVKSVVFNGWVSGIDPKTGNDFRSCIISCQASREEFETFNLDRVEPKECFKNLKGLAAGPLAQLAPVRPIMEIKTEDSRFVESREVLADINSTTNLATMEWEAFEHLVRELFAKIFSKDGGEVRVTQASRDGGVDAIAFDPDPIRGGKFVIQAKRYNNVVPVSAARDLYGTMISEGASKGILVTTSYYGNDSREFVKDKPITLVDGSNLVYMLQEYGHNVRIELQNKTK